MAVARHLRYSPRNYLIVDWSAHGQAFSDCGLPKPVPCLIGASACGDDCLHPLPIQEAIDTYDWERFLPEVIVGIDDPDEEIAANYVRQAAIEFAKGSRVLQREVVIEVQPDIHTYPVFPYEGERIIGVIAVISDDGTPCSCAQFAGQWEGQRWRLDCARNEFSLERVPKCGRIRLLVWASPTEDACAYDRFLYDNFRADITLGARHQYARTVHFRDRALMATIPALDDFNKAIVSAKSKAVSLPSSWQSRPGSTFADGGGCTREDYYFHRR